jgi:hypothetical protein
MSKGEYVQIPLRGIKSENKFTLVDIEDLDKISKYKWHISKGYAQSSVNIKGNRVTIKLHRIITKPNKNEEIDHINHNKLDNRKENLRVCTRKQNTRNTLKRKNCSSKYKGVTWKTHTEKWRSRLFNNKNISLGCFEDEKDAARAYNEKAKELFGEFAHLNEISD